MQKDIEAVNEEKVSIYLVLSDTGTLLNRSVKRYTKAPYNHVSISFDENLDNMFSFGRKRPNNPIYGGFVKEEVLGGMYMLFPKTLCAIYRLEVGLEVAEKMRKVVHSFEVNKEDYRYNLLGLFGVIFNLPIETKNSYFCSQFVAEVFEKTGIQVWGKSPALVTPDDFRELEDKKLVYEGKLLEYTPIKEKMEKMLQPSLVETGLENQWEKEDLVTTTDDVSMRSGVALAESSPYYEHYIGYFLKFKNINLQKRFVLRFLNKILE